MVAHQSFLVSDQLEFPRWPLTRAPTVSSFKNQPACIKLLFFICCLNGVTDALGKLIICLPTDCRQSISSMRAGSSPGSSPSLLLIFTREVRSRGAQGVMGIRKGDTVSFFRFFSFSSPLALPVRSTLRVIVSLHVRFK